MNCCDDIVLEKGKALYYLRFLDWDTNFFGLPSFILDENKSNLVPEPKLIELFAEKLKISFITAKLNSDIDREELHFLQETGFKYIGSEVTLKFVSNSGSGTTVSKDIKYERLTSNRGLPYNTIGSLFINTRFHSDVHIDKKKADLLWVEYIENYLVDQDNHIFVAQAGGQIASVILVGKDKETSCMRLNFVATRKEFQNQGIGSGLIRFVVGNFKDSVILVGTQVKNSAALNFYIRNGFAQVFTNKIVMHRWSV